MKSPLSKSLAVPQEWAEEANRKKRRRQRRKKRVVVDEVDEQEMIRQAHDGSILPKKKKAVVARMEAARVAMEYNRKRANYFDHRISDWRRLLENPGAYMCCSIAALNAASCGATIEHFVESQFWYTNKHFGEAPTFFFMAAEGSLSRYEKWKTSRGDKEAPERTVSVIRGHVEVTSTAKQKYEEKIFARMVRKWGGERQMWSLFGEEEVFFSQAFKESRPIWVEMFSH